MTKLQKAACATTALVVASPGAGAARRRSGPGRRRTKSGAASTSLIDGKPFTSYIWPTTLKKPTLFPLRSANGTIVTRGYPLEPRKNERVDHPHHVGLWLNSRRRQRPRLLEQLRRDQARPAAEDGHDPPSQDRRRGQGRQGQRDAGRRDRVGQARRQPAAEGAHRVRVPRRREVADDRSHDDADRARREGGVQGQQGSVLRDARRARAGAALRQGRSADRCIGQADTEADHGQHRRQRSVHEQRRAAGRRGVGHARPLDDADRNRLRTSR